MTDRERFIAARKQVGLTQPELAKILKVKRRTVQDWEYGVSTPRGGWQAAIQKAEALTAYNRGALEQFLSGDLNIEDAIRQEHPKQALDSLSLRLLGMIPEKIKKKLEQEDMTELMKALSMIYEAGRQDT